jgi:hypothetical protein
MLPGAHQMLIIAGDWTSLHSRACRRASARAFPKRFEREGPNSTVKRRSTASHATPTGATPAPSNDRSRPASCPGPPARFTMAAERRSLLPTPT